MAFTVAFPTYAYYSQDLVATDKLTARTTSFFSFLAGSPVESIMTLPQ